VRDVALLHLREVEARDDPPRFRGVAVLDRGFESLA
jgi:hypothetical protein